MFTKIYTPSYTDTMAQAMRLLESVKLQDDKVTIIDSLAFQSVSQFFSECEAPTLYIKQILQQAQQ